MSKMWTFLLAVILSVQLSAQIVSLKPSNAGADDEVTLLFDATQGNAELLGASKVYLHHGVVIDSSTGSDWNYVIGDWGKDNGVGEMTRMAGESDLWEIKFTPSLREYFKVPDSEDIYRVSAVFRSADGGTKGTITPGNYGWGEVTSDGDFYINLNVSDFVTITHPFQTETFLSTGETIEINAVASSNVSSMSLLLDEGEGYSEVKNVTSGRNISYTYMPTKTVSLGIKVSAIIKDEKFEEEKIHQTVFIGESQQQKLPEGFVPGINYHEYDASKVTLVLEAPGKDFAYVVGDVSNWLVLDKFKMKQTPDGEFFWIELNELVSGQDYVFQYWIDGKIKVGDPYADQVADPWNDKEIEEEVFPSLPEYNLTQHSIATVFKTGQSDYKWSDKEAEWQKPDINNLIIYELHVRDFLASHSYLDLIDTLSYLKNLGVEAIELMPLNEFEGNDSWGYNPSYYFAPDKFYGTKNDLKLFVEKAHEHGMAVILDMVLNHAFGSNPMVRMYWDETNSRPADDNPWFNSKHAGQYQWGYDFNHESKYTQYFVDRVNKYWLNEFHFDGFRFDFTKGFTNYAPGGSVDGFDQSRINILKRMADEIWKVNSSAYVILEHWGTDSEEKILGEFGMKMWRNRSYDFVPAVTGQSTGSFGGLSNQSQVIYFNSHDERRIAEHALAEGLSNGNYDIKDLAIMYERVKMAAAFAFLNPGPKMMWQFDELGYDVHIDFNGRVGRKPLPWGDGSLGYYADENRQYIYEAYQGILEVRQTIGALEMADAKTNHKNSGSTRRLSYNTGKNDLVLIGNFGLETSSVNPEFSESGSWFDYFSGAEITVTDVESSIELNAGEWHIYTSERISNGLPGVVEVFESPVAISPKVFTMNDNITISFDATKAWNDDTNGLIDAEKVYLHAGLVTVDPSSQEMSHVVGTMADDGLGLMNKTGEQTWEISFVPSEYFDTPEAFKIGFYFRDANNENVGKGFRNNLIFYPVLSEKAIVSIDPPAFEADDEITVTFNAMQGNGELMGAAKVYMHSGVSITGPNSPQSEAWNQVVGNWGADDGIGEMAQVEANIWQISMIPSEYYDLAADEHPFWMACVFRSFDGKTKGTAAPGDFEYGFVSSSSDYFIENQLTIEDNELSGDQPRIYPNPVHSILNFDSFEGEMQFKLTDTCGRIMLLKNLVKGDEVDVSHLSTGIYIYHINTNEKSVYGRIVKN